MTTFPLLCVVRSVKFWVAFFVAGTVQLLAASPPPKLVPLAGLPAGVRQYASLAETAEGWVAATADGVLAQNGDVWTLLRIPGGGEVSVVVPWGDTFLAAGRGFCSAYTTHGWEPVAIDDEIYAGAALDGAAFLSGRHGIYRVSASGSLERILPITAERNVYLHVIRGHLYIFAVDRGPLVWTGSELKPAENMAWAKNVTVVSVQECDDGRLFAVTSEGMFMVTGENTMAVCPNLFIKILRGTVVNVTLFGDHLIATMYYGGLVSVSLASGEVEWQLTPEALGGNAYFAREYRGGLLIGTSGGVYALHNPDRFPSLSLPAGDVLFIARLADGVRIGLTTGVFTASGRAVLHWDQAHRDPVYSMAENGLGKVINGYYGKFEVDGKALPLEGREVNAIAVSKSGRFAVMQPHGVSLLGDDGAPHLLPIDSVTTSLVAYQDEFLVGTSTGIVRVSVGGELQGRFGHGMSKVFSCGTGVVGVDVDGQVFGGDGTLLGTTPPAETIGAAEWRGNRYLLARLADGSNWLGQIDAKTKGWHPLDIPLPASPRALTVDGDHLLVIAPETIFTINSAEPLTTPPLGIKLLHVDGRRLAGGDLLAPSEGSIEIRFPPPRLGGWKNPQYEIRVGDGPWETVTQGVIQVPRLTWGRNKIEVRGTWAGIHASTELFVQRRWPWWARLPMAIIYLLALVGLGYGVIRWRTSALERRARQLGLMVQDRTAELMRAQQAREEFFSTVSHEIRNPLNGVVGLCEILNEAPRDAVAPRERMFVRTLRDCADQLRTILDDVLDFTRIDRGDIQFNEEVFDARSAIEGAVRTVDVSLERCSVEAAQVEGWLRGDVGKIRQIIINLVTNALKYGLPSAAKIVASTEMQANGRARLTLSVRNTGPTIPGPELLRIFEGFTRGRDALARRIPGSGIGLAVSKRIATAMGGNLTVTSQDGVTEFTLVLELVPGIPPLLSEKRSSSRKSGSKALAIEDEPYNRLVLGSILEQLGYEVDWAADGGTAIQKAKTTAYDLVLTDYMLPDIDGATLARKLLSLMREPKPPIIAVTAYSTPEKIAEAKAAGISGYVVKPVSLRKIESAITSSTPVVQIHRTLTPSSHGRCDFSDLRRLDNGNALVAEYGAGLNGAWSKIVNLLGSDPMPSDKVARESHAFRSRLLAVHAEEAAEQVALLEEAARRGERDICLQLAEVVNELVDEVAQAAKQHSPSLN
jgi:signal transduction histidine kinase/ActR/RegA family two-component response regulator